MGAEREKKVFKLKVILPVPLSQSLLSFFSNMATDSNSKVLSDPTKSRKDLLGAARLLRIQYIQIEALVKQRKLLEDQFEFLRNRWISDIRHYRDEVFQVIRYLGSTSEL